MDFGRPLEKNENGLVARSNIRRIMVKPSSSYVSSSSTNDGRSGAPSCTSQSSSLSLSLDERLIQAANNAVTTLFGSSSEYDCTSFPEYTLQSQSSIIRSNDLVVVFESFDNLSFVYAKPGHVFTNRNGTFAHDDFIGSPWGSKVRSTSHQGYGFVYLLKPTPELWTRSLVHRTQIIHELDTSMIIYQLWLRPNMTVVESGTGSGALSHAILRTIAPHGKLYTYEFHNQRYVKAKGEFAQHSLSHLVECHHIDVTQDHGFVGLMNNNDDETRIDVDAVVLDLPEPWLVVRHASRILKGNGRIASYSPCVEQALKTTVALEQHGFHSLSTMEFRLREYYVDPNGITWDTLPTELRPGRRQSQQQQQDDDEEGVVVDDDDDDEHCGQRSSKRKRTIDEENDDDGNDDRDTHKTRKEQQSHDDDNDVTTPTTPTDVVQAPSSSPSPNTATTNNGNGMLCA